MFKKWVVAVLLPIIVAAAGFYVYQKTRLVKVASLEDIVPGNELVYYIAAYDLNKKVQDFQSGSLFQKVSELSVYQENVAPELDKMKARLPFLPDLISQDTAFVVFSLDTAGRAEDFLFLSRLDMKKFSQIKRQLGEFYRSQIAKEDKSVKVHDGIKITAFKFPQEDMNINAAILSDVLLVSNNIGILKETIDLYKSKSKNSLSNNLGFRNMSSRLKKDALLWGYQDNVNYSNQMLRRYDSVVSGGVRQADYLKVMRSFANLAGVFKETAFYVDYSDSKDGLISKSYALLDRGKDEFDLLDAVVSKETLDQGALKLMPKGALACYAGRINAMAYWNFLKKILKSLEDSARKEQQPRVISMGPMTIDDGLKQVSAFLGVDPEKEVLPLLEDNLGFVFKDIDDVDMVNAPPAGAMPAAGAAAKPSMPALFPQVYFFSGLKDGVKMQAVLSKMTENLVKKVNDLIKEQDKQFQIQAKARGYVVDPMSAQQALNKPDPITLKKETYKDADIYYLDLLDFPIRQLQPNYVVLDKYLVVSLSNSMTKEIIDLYRGTGESLLASSHFKSIQEKVAVEYSNILFLDIKEMINSVRALRVFKMIDDTNSRRSTKGFTKEKFEAVLDVLSNIASVTVTSKMSDEEIVESTSYIEVEGL